MFVTRKRLEDCLYGLYGEIKFMNDKYWDLWHKHERLMRYLGLEENTRSGVEILKKGGPERGDTP